MKLFAVLAAFAIAFTFAACDNGSGSDTPAMAETTVTNPNDTTEEQNGTDGENNGSTETGGNGTTTTDPTTEPAAPANPSDDDSTETTGSGESTGGTSEEQNGADGEADTNETGGNGTTTTDPTTDPADSANQSDNDDTDTTGSGENTGDTSDTPIIYIGTKAPGEAKAVGDIVFSDGSATPYASGLELTDAQKEKAIAVIFYVGTELNSGHDATTSRTLGVGLAHDRNGLAWCTNGANAYSKNITTIQCRASGSAGALTFTRDKDGSNNLEQIRAFLKAADGVEDDTTTAENYPAFYFAKNYARQKIGTETESRIAAGSEYADGWYLPTVAELFQIWKSKATVDAASALCGGSQFDTDIYWSSSQFASDDPSAYYLGFYDGNWDFSYKIKSYSYVCAVREF